ncbi:MAG: hypothetical protein [Olavius algarvensis Gamma 1 endosymbiont]|nr:MAG: hypothetical protein [Olavius algarvensis Gamma 1 endosymbiont]
MDETRHFPCAPRILSGSNESAGSLCRTGHDTGRWSDLRPGGTRLCPAVVSRLVPVDNSLIFISFVNRLRAKRTDSLTNRFFLLSIRPV